MKTAAGSARAPIAGPLRPPPPAAGVDGALLERAAAAAGAVLRRMIWRTSFDDQTSALEARNSASTVSALRVAGFSSGSALRPRHDSRSLPQMMRARYHSTIAGNSPWRSLHAYQAQPNPRLALLKDERSVKGLLELGLTRSCAPVLGGACSRQWWRGLRPRCDPHSCCPRLARSASPPRRCKYSCCAQHVMVRLSMPPGPCKQRKARWTRTPVYAGVYAMELHVQGTNRENQGRYRPNNHGPQMSSILRLPLTMLRPTPTPPTSDPIVTLALYYCQRLCRA